MKWESHFWAGSHSHCGGWIGCRYNDEQTYSTLSCFPFTPFYGAPWWFNSLHSLNADLLPQLTGAYASILPEQRMIRRKFAELTKKQVSFFSPLFLSLSLSADGQCSSNSQKLKMLLALLYHRSIHQSEKVAVRLEGPFCPVRDRIMDIQADDHGPSFSSTYFRRSLASYHTANS